MARPPEGSAPLVSVVIPVLNGERTLPAALTSVLRTDYPAERREIVVVDNGSTDDTPHILRDFDVRVLHEPKRSPSVARNRGIEASGGDLVAFTDADCVVSSRWLAELVNGFADARVGGVAGEILPFPPRTAAERYAARIRHLSPERYLRREKLPFAVTANLAFRRGVFDRVGLLDESAPRGGESTDFCTRFFRRTGLELRFAPKAVVLHRHRSSAWGLFKQHWGYGRGHAYLYMKYADEIPWGWSETARVYRDLALAGSSLITTASRRLFGRAQGDDLPFRYFELLRKLALRGGFAREALSRGRLHL